MSIVSDLLGTLDDARALLDDVGLRPFSVVVRKVEWSGVRVGHGVATVTNTPITVAGGRRPKVVEVHDEDVAAGGPFDKTRFEIRNITPEYAGGGVAPETLDPDVGSHPTQIFYVLSGPGLPTDGMLCEKVGGKFDRVFGYSVTVETLGKTAT